MIAQIWRGVTRAADRETCVAQVLAGIHAALADATTCKGTYLFTRPSNEADVELIVLTLFEAATVTSCHEGEALFRAEAFGRPLPLAFDRRIAIYEVLTEPGRTSSYANLRRRFPLRLMAPR
jgi:hypothetical protein